MSGQEKLFAALSGVDEDLLKRSEKDVRGRSRWLKWGVTLAACLALVISSVVVAPAAVRPPEDIPPEETADPPGGPAVSLPEGEEQRRHFLRFRLDRKQDAPGFSIFVDEESYQAYEQDGVYIIRPRLEAEGLPPCRLEISWTGTPPEEEVHNQAARLGSLYENVWDSHSAVLETMWPPPWDAYVLWGDSGTDWDDAQRLTWVTGDGRGGSFVLSASYFMEAAEGHGAMFYDMMCTFQTEPEEIPAWRAALEAAAEKAVREALPGGASAASLDYSLSGDGESASAQVTVQYRLGGEEPYEALVLTLVCRDGAWTRQTG